MPGPNAVMVPSPLTMNCPTEGRGSLHFASLGMRMSNIQKLGMIELMPLGRSTVSPRVKRWLCFCFKNTIYSWTCCVYTSAGRNWSKTQKTTNELMWREALTNFITSCLLFSLYPQQEEKQNILYLMGILGPAYYTRGWFSPWEPRLWAGGKSSAPSSPPSPGVASMRRRSAEDQALGLAEQV